MTIVDTEILANSVVLYGGAVGIFATDPQVLIERSTLSGNEAFLGGALYNTSTEDVGGGSVVIRNSTLSGNAADVAAGGNGNAIHQASLVLPTTVEASTIAANSGQGGTAAVVSEAGEVEVVGSILDNSPANCAGGSVVSTGIGSNVSSDGTCNFSGPGDLNSEGPILGGLADNGGPTMTHMLLAGSPAIDLLDSCLEGLDQRGRWRPVGSFCDAGAVEFGLPNIMGSLVWGNVNCDNSIQLNDALLILEFAAVGNENTSVGDCPDTGSYAYVEFETTILPATLWGDLNCDGIIDGMDALYVVLFDDTNGNGLPVSPGCPEVGAEIEDGE